MATETSGTVSGTKLSYAKAVEDLQGNPPVSSENESSGSTIGSAKQSREPTNPEKTGGQIKEDVVSALLSNMDQLRMKALSAVHKSEQDAPREALALLIGQPVPEGVTVRFLYWTEDYYTCKCESEEELVECYGDCPGAAWAGEPMFEVQLNGQAAYTDDRSMAWQGDHAEYAELVRTELRKPVTRRLAQRCAKRLADR